MINATRKAIKNCQQLLNYRELLGRSANNTYTPNLQTITGKSTQYEL